MLHSGGVGNPVIIRSRRMRVGDLHRLVKSQLKNKIGLLKFNGLVFEDHREVELSDYRIEFQVRE